MTDCEVSETLEPSQMTQASVMEASSRCKGSRQQYLCSNFHRIVFHKLLPLGILTALSKTITSFCLPNLSQKNSLYWISWGRVSSEGHCDTWSLDYFSLSSQDCFSVKTLKAITLFRWCLFFSHYAAAVSSVTGWGQDNSCDIPFGLIE